MQIEKLVLKRLDGVIAERAHARSFTLPSLAPEAEKPPVTPAAPPPLTQNDLKQAEQEGYRKGFFEGEKEGRMQAESEQARVSAQLEQALTQLAGQVQSILEAHRREVTEAQKFLPKLALSIARKVAGAALDVNPLPLVEATVIQCVERILSAPEIVITVNDALTHPLEEKLAQHFAHSNEPGEITIRGDEHMGIADCRIAWGNGQASRNTEALWQEVETIIAGMVAEAPRQIATPQGLSTPTPDARS